MAYSTAAQVQAIVVTDMAPADITELIEESDAWMDLKLNTGGLNAIILRMISRTMTAIRVMLKDPDAESLAEYRMSRGVALGKLNSMLDEMLSDAGSGITFTMDYENIQGDEYE